jgi:hypothetical protein
VKWRARVEEFGDIAGKAAGPTSSRDPKTAGHARCTSPLMASHA